MIALTDLFPFDDVTSRLFYWNGFGALLMFIIWSRYSYQGHRWQLRKFFGSFKFWMHPSAITDYLLWMTNIFWRSVVLVPALDFSFRIASIISRFLVGTFEAWVFIELNIYGVLIATILTFIWDDFLRFSQHYLMHRFAFLWRIHSVHHSATVLTPLTVFRAHPLEVAISILRNSLSIGVSSGIFVFIFQAPLTLWTVMGIHGLGFLFNLFGANLRHSQIPIRYPAWAEKYLISPAMHQLHHSSDPDHSGKNLGVSLAVWDRIFGTYSVAIPQKRMQFGLKDSREMNRWLSLLSEWRRPFLN